MPGHIVRGLGADLPGEGILRRGNTNAEVAVYRHFTEGSSELPKVEAPEPPQEEPKPETPPKEDKPVTLRSPCRTGGPPSLF